MTTREKVWAMYLDPKRQRPPSMGVIAEELGSHKSLVFKYIHELNKLSTVELKKLLTRLNESI